MKPTNHPIQLAPDPHITGKTLLLLSKKSDLHDTVGGLSFEQLFHGQAIAGPAKKI